jgi:hypothetical protein
MTEESERQLSEIRSSLALAPEEIPVGDLFPVFVPASFFALGTWPGPYQMLAVRGLGLTWAIERPQQAMLYVNDSLADYWKAADIDWRQEATRNLERRSHPDFSTGCFVRDGQPGTVYALIFMHPDGYGPSRLLLRERLCKAFPQGYLVGLPEMSCGLALALDAAPAERNRVEEVVEKCYRQGTRPLVPGLHAPSLLAPGSSSE